MRSKRTNPSRRVHVLLPKEYLERLKSFADKHNFTSVAELVRSSIRDILRSKGNRDV